MGIIYRHISPSGKSYIGQSRYDSWELRVGHNPLKAYENSRKFLNAIKKYGWENFSHEIIQSGLDDLKLRNEAERNWIIHFDSIVSGYNQKLGGYHDGIYIPRTSEIELNPQEIASMYEEGFSLREIAPAFECSYIAIRNVLLDHGVILRGHGAMPKAFKPKTYPVLSCAVCKKDFEQNRAGKTTCSNSCRSILGRARALGVTVESLLDKRRQRSAAHTASSK